MRLITSLLILAAASETATAHTGGGLLPEALSHQLLGLHHLPFSILLVIATVIVIRRWQSRKRAD
jgi:hypothetical protein